MRILRAMARTDPQVNFRIPAELLEKLRGASELNNRTLTAELVSRLEASFDPAKATPDVNVKGIIQTALADLYKNGLIELTEKAKGK